MLLSCRAPREFSRKLLVQPLAKPSREWGCKPACFLLVLVFLTPNDLAHDHLTTSIMQTVAYPAEGNELEDMAPETFE